MTEIYPITALQKNVAAVKDAARHHIVHITENGRSGYIFATEETFDEYVARQRAEAAREALLFLAIDRGEQDLAEGRVGTAESVDELFRQLDEATGATGAVACG